MAFPTTPLTLLVELALNANLNNAPGTWSWTDATAYVRSTSPVSITRGRPDETSTADAAKLTFIADNTDGRWSTGNANGAWYGQIRKGTPIRVSAEGHVRFTGFISALPPRRDVSSKDLTANVEARGLLYRISNGGGGVVKSALLRSLAVSGPTIYWPFEDGSDATSVASGLLGGASLTYLTAGFVPGAQGGPIGSDVFASYTESAATNSVGFAGTIDLTSYSLSSTKVSVGYLFAAFLATSPHPTNFEPFSIITSTGVQLTLPTYAGYVSGARTSTFGIDMFPGAVGGSTIGSGFDPYDGNVHSILATWTQVGADITETMSVDGVTMISTTKTGTTMGSPASLNLGVSPGGTLDSTADNNTGATLSLGHFTIWGNVAATDPHAAATGYIGEASGTRFLRLSAEEGVTASGWSGDRLMGAQGVNNYLTLIRECEAVEQGFIYEDLAFGLFFQSLAGRYNLSTALSLNFTAAGNVAPPLEPTDDDQRAFNDVTVTRAGGTLSRRTLESGGELSVQNIGRRIDSQTYSLASDALTGPLADRRLFVLTFPGYRVPVLTLDLAAGPGLISSFTAAGLAFRTTVGSPPVDTFIDSIDLMVEGYDETFGQYDWGVAANCSPYRTNLIDTVESAVEAWAWRIDHSASSLAANLASGATSASVATTGSLWTTVGGDFPFWINVEGEKIRVTAVSGSSSPQTFTIVRSENGIVKSHFTGNAVTLWQPAVIGL